MQEVVESFIAQYKLEYDFFLNLSRKACEICDRELVSMGIKAITSWRAKKPESLRIKLLKRDKLKKYTDHDAIRGDIADFAGIRIALYFPNERESVDRLITSTFQVVQKKSFPEAAQNPTYKKRFSGYWANHYRVRIGKEEVETRYTENLVEIQVASVLMHAWSEIEHDLVYKPNIGQLPEEELQILDEINGLVLVGEIALERLQKAVVARTSRKASFDNSFELKSYLSGHISNIDSRDVGNIKYLNEIMKTLNYNSKSKIEKILKNLNYYSNETVADEIIDSIVRDLVKNDRAIEEILNQRKTKAEQRSGFENYLRLWILLEKVNESFNRQFNTKTAHSPIKFDLYSRNEILNRNEIDALREYRQIRNQIIHGKGIYEDTELLRHCDGLKELLLKMISAVEESGLRDEFRSEFSNIESR